ncbi:MAG TPA: LLM class flavin-dependent oxidoreductase, partial [Sulfitobacter sp.]|nr:LLM class flavin-dependent oxidoreductase [Sulfitobacter sp.]
RTPEAPALVFEGETLSYAALNACANQLAHVLGDMGAGPGMPVALCVARGVDLLVGTLGILKAGAAYVPLDPAYPADRLAHYLSDSGAAVVVTQSALSASLPAQGAQVLELDRDTRLATASDVNPAASAGPDDLAYLIYTSGSTGTPKGVMVSHGNVANFFAGMDDRIDHEAGAVWLAVTSLSFDISVLELFWTLARGIKLVLAGDDSRALMSNGPIATSDRKIDFNLFYWGNDDGVGPKKYELLLEGARFADANGFNAVWTPERHFHAFGGPYPNPSVTGAAVAAVTQNLDVRAGSCVAPLHHPARIAEEWAVIDNLTNGRVGLAIASGWQPDDFVLRPENTPPQNKPAMYDAIDQLRKLWAGEPVEFPRADGAPHAVVTQPRPVSNRLPIWVTTAGNPQTWKEAGEIGANVLTHLLGQSVEEVADKIKIYHDALRGAGHDPADHRVTVMLHSYLAETRAEAEEIARAPMKDYLRSAAGLIKQYAWAFPAFKRPEGAKNAFDLSLDGLTEEEMDAILDFAFQRYFEDSGLFGTVEDAVARVES